MSAEERTLTRDTEATVIPYGDPMVIPEGTVVTIAQKLGGNFTVTFNGGMVSIAGKDADALGEETAENPALKEENYTGGAPEKDVLWKSLKEVYDPEIPVNIVDLGLVYTLEVIEKDADTFDVRVDMTLTAPGCGMGPIIAEDAKYKLESVSGVNEATVDIVWDPPWHQDMISEEGKMELGLI